MLLRVSTQYTVCDVVKHSHKNTDIIINALNVIARLGA